jgi:hypothetical protein
VLPCLPQERRGLPSTLEGFKAHEVYVLDRHIGKYQAVRPEAQKCGNHRCGGMVGLCGGVGCGGRGRWRVVGGRRQCCAKQLVEAAGQSCCCSQYIGRQDSCHALPLLPAPLLQGRGVLEALRPGGAPHRRPLAAPGAGGAARGAALPHQAHQEEGAAQQQQRRRRRWWRRRGRVPLVCCRRCCRWCHPFFPG